MIQVREEWVYYPAPRKAKKRTAKKRRRIRRRKGPIRLGLRARGRRVARPVSTAVEPFQPVPAGGGVRAPAGAEPFRYRVEGAQKYIVAVWLRPEEWAMIRQIAAEAMRLTAGGFPRTGVVASELLRLGLAELERRGRIVWE